MTPEQYEQIAVLTKAQFPEWNTLPDEPLVRWWAEITGRVPRDEAWLNARTLATLFSTVISTTAGPILRGTQIMQAIRAAGAAGNALFADVADWMQQVSGLTPGVDAAHPGVWALIQQLFGALGITSEELAVIDHWRTRDATRAEVAGFGIVYEYDITRALRGGA